MQWLMLAELPYYDFKYVRRGGDGTGQEVASNQSSPLAQFLMKGCFRYFSDSWVAFQGYSFNIKFNILFYDHLLNSFDRNN